MAHSDSPTATTPTGPTTTSPGPQHAPRHQHLQAAFTRPDSIEQAWVSQTAPRHNGPPEVEIVADDDATRQEALAAAEAAAANLPLPGVAPDARPSPLAETATNPALPPETTVAGTVLIYQHPLARDVAAALAGHDAVDDYRVSWSPSHDRLTIEPAMTAWNELAPLGVEVTLPADAPDSALEDVTRTVRAASVADRPLAYIAAIEDPNTVAPSPSADATFTIGFADREAKADARSRVYRADGADVPALVGGSDSTVGDDGVQLTVTSPPYLDAIDYDTHASGEDGDWTEYSMTDEEVAAWMEHQRRLFEGVYEATREGGYCAVVIGSVKRDDGTDTPLPHHFTQVMQDAGWQYHEEIVWNKVTGGSTRFGTTVQHPYPTYYYPNRQHESVLVFRKGDVVNRKDEASQFAMTELVKKEIANNVWHVPPVPHNGGIDHPCPFPEEIVHRLTLLYSCEGDVVLDPMAGSGTTVQVADRLARVGVGTEIRPEYVATARERLVTEEYERGTQLLPAFESVEVCQDETAVGEADGDGAGAGGEQATEGQTRLGAFGRPEEPSLSDD